MRLLLFFLSVCACAYPAKKTICLNMIVKNENPIILECLASVKPLIDHWVIVDTGSTDGTQTVIRDYLKEIPGELVERPWVHFAHNRNEALQLAKEKGDYLLFIDADEKLVFDDSFTLPPLSSDYYYAVVDTGGLEFMRITLASNRFQWNWTGVLHEIISSPDAKKYDLLKGVTNQAFPNRGNRSKDPEKYLKDAKLLEEELTKDPANTRNLLHLAQTYVNANLFEKGMKTYEKRAQLGGFEEEVYFCKLMVAKLQEHLKMASETVQKSYWQAHLYRPTRAESLYYSACHFIAEKNYAESYKMTQKAISISRPADTLLVEGWIYEWGALYAHIEACFHLDKIDEMGQMMRRMLQSKTLPDHLRQETEQNLSILSKSSTNDASILRR